MARIIRLNYNDDYKIIDLPTAYEEFRMLCGKEFDYKYDSSSVRYYFITYDENGKIQITQDNFKQFSTQDLLEILIESEFPKKVYDLDNDIDLSNEYSSTLINCDTKAINFPNSGTLTIEIKNNGKSQWPLPLTLSPLKASTIFSSDYAITKKVYPKEIIQLTIHLLDIKSKIPGKYVLFMQLKRKKVMFGDIFKFSYTKT